MSISEFFGIVLILGACLYTWYRVHSNSVNRSVFIAFAITWILGLAVYISDRITELPMPFMTSTLKAAAKQALVDAKTISHLKGEIESQRQSVGDVVKKSQEAQELIKKLNRDSEEISGKIKHLDEMTEIQELISRAQNEDAQALQSLRKIADGKNSKYRDLVNSAIVRIRTEYAGPISRGFLKIPWKDGVNPSEFSLDDFKRNYAEIPTLYHADLLKHVKNSSKVSRREKMEFYIDAIQNSPNLLARDYAARYFTEAANDSALESWQPFKVDPLLEWWSSHKDSIND